jgi:hypothetical protein
MKGNAILASGVLTDHGNVVYLTKMSVTRAVYRGMARQFMKNELERSWKDAVIS